MKKIFYLFIALIISGATSGAWAQNECQGYMPVKVGASFSYEYYDAKGKLESKSTSTVKDLSVSGDILTVTVHAVHMDNKGKVENEGDISFTCQNGEIKMDMRSMMNQEQMEGFEDMEVTIDQTNLYYPAVLTPGTTLPDGKLTMKIDMGGMAMNMIMDIVDRKVEAAESMTTPAGTFDCMKLTQTEKMDMGMMKTTSSSKEWLAMGIGIVRQEHYNDKGELTGYMILTSVTQ